MGITTLRVEARKQDSQQTEFLELDDITLLENTKRESLARSTLQQRFIHFLCDAKSPGLLYQNLTRAEAQSEPPTGYIYNREEFRLNFNLMRVGKESDGTLIYAIFDPATEYKSFLNRSVRCTHEIKINPTTKTITSVLKHSAPLPIAKISPFISHRDASGREIESEKKILARLRQDSFLTEKFLGVASTTGEYVKSCDNKDLFCQRREYVEGTLLEDYIKTEDYRNKSDGEKTALGIELLQRLQDIHDAGYVHSDVTLANILITASGKIVIFDFDLSVKIGHPFAGTTKSYEAPEIQKFKIERRDRMRRGTAQKRNEAESEKFLVNSTQDIYAAGIVLTSMLSGQTGQERSMKTGSDYIKATLSKLNKNSSLKPFIEKVTAENPNQRYQSCNEAIISLLNTAIQRKNITEVINARPNLWHQYFAKPTDLFERFKRSVIGRFFFKPTSCRDKLSGERLASIVTNLKDDDSNKTIICNDILSDSVLFDRIVNAKNLSVLHYFALYQAADESNKRKLLRPLSFFDRLLGKTSFLDNFGATVMKEVVGSQANNKIEKIAIEFVDFVRATPTYFDMDVSQIPKAIASTPVIEALKFAGHFSNFAVDKKATKQQSRLEVESSTILKMISPIFPFMGSSG